MLNLQFIKLPHGQDLPSPKYQTKGAAGFDLQAALGEGESILLKPQEYKLIPTGIALMIPFGYEGQIRPRSGLALKSGITCLNSPGTIDSDYRGEIKVLLINHSCEDFLITHGIRIAQMVIAPVVQMNFSQVEILEETERGAQGFGSTGR